MPYKVIEIFNDLPKTNCKKCDKPGCYQFALSVYLNESELSQCTELTSEQFDIMTGKLNESRDLGEGKMPQNHQQALTRLFEVMEIADMAKMADNAGGTYTETPESIRIKVFKDEYTVKRDDVVTPDGIEDNIWEKVLALLYITLADGSPEVGQWVTYRELPNTISKAQSIDDEYKKLTEAFSGKEELLQKQIQKVGGSKVESESADCTFEIVALPKVTLRLLFWEGDDDFPPRFSVLMDKGIFNYLDQEAAVFLVEVLVKRLIEDIQ